MKTQDKLQSVREWVQAACPEIEGYCSLSKRVDGKTHSPVFDGDDPYTVCAFCDERRSAPSGMLITPGRGESYSIGIAEVLRTLESSEIVARLDTHGQLDVSPFKGDCQWNFLQDDLNLASPECVDLLYSLIPKK
jgi:hypothetical protein